MRYLCTIVWSFVRGTGIVIVGLAQGAYGSVCEIIRTRSFRDPDDDDYYDGIFPDDRPPTELVDDPDVE